MLFRSYPERMHLFELTRRLVDMDSTTGREDEVAAFLAACLRGLGADATIDLTLDITDVKHLDRVVATIKRIRGVRDIERP